MMNNNTRNNSSNSNSNLLSTTTSTTTLSSQQSTLQEDHLGLHHRHHRRHNNSKPNPYPLPIPWKYMPHFILGVSTGHAGSTSLHQALVLGDCPWHNPDQSILVNQFETVVPNQTIWDYTNGDANFTTTTTTTTTLHVSCQFVSQVLLPHILQTIIESTSAESSFLPHFRHGNHSTTSSFSSTKWQSRQHQSTMEQHKQHHQLSYWSKTTFLDLGHYHNRGQVLECLALLLKNKLTLIRIRRHRYDIAYSFATHYQTPCCMVVNNDDDDHSTTTMMTDTHTSDVKYHDDHNNNTDTNHHHHHPTMDSHKTHSHNNNSFNNNYIPMDNNTSVTKKVHPRVTTCPRSTERIGKVALPLLNDDIWDNNFTTFQQFLWYTDEMELRWYRMKQYFQRRQRSPTFWEVTWSTPEEFRTELQRLRHNLHCTPLKEIPNLKQHTHKTTFTSIWNSNNNHTNPYQTHNNSNNNNIQSPQPLLSQQQRWMTDSDMIRQDLEYQQQILQSWQQLRQQQQQQQKNKNSNRNNSTSNTTERISTSLVVAVVADTMDSIIDMTTSEQWNDILFWSSSYQQKWKK